MIVYCPSGGDVRLFLEHKLRYELLLFGKQLPDDTGRALARFARSQAFYHRTPIIILSASKPRHVGAGVYFEKPDDASAL
jgi:DNA-binding response OmpR family regulator